MIWIFFFIIIIIISVCSVEKATHALWLIFFFHRSVAPCNYKNKKYKKEKKMGGG